jgi:hypothetical protein
MFLPWFSANARVEVPSLGAFEAAQDSVNAWQSLSVIDLVLLAIVLLVLGLALARAAGVTLPALPAPPALIIAGAGLFAVVLIVYRLADPPSPDFQLAIGTPDVGRRFGLLIALLASAGISYGGYRALTDEAR